MAFERKYSDEVRAKSVETVLRRRREEPGNRSIIREVADEYDVGQQSLRQWITRYDDGSYDYAEEPAERVSPTTRHASLSRPELIALVTQLEQRIEILEEDNRSLSRVVSLFSGQMRQSA